MMDVPILANWDGNGIAMQPNAAAAGVATGAAVLFLVARKPLAVRVAAILVTAIGAATVFENLSSVDLGIDRALLFGREWGGQATAAPGRMGIPVSVSWTLLGDQVEVILIGILRNP